MKLLRRTMMMITLLLTCLIPGFSKSAGFQTGAGVYFESSPVVDGFDLCIWGLKLDMRFNALNGWFAFETPVALGFDEDIVELSLEPGAMLSIPFGSQLGLDGGIGTRMKVTLNTDGTWTVNGAGYETTGSAFKLMKPDYRIGMMFDFDALSIRFSSRIPTEGTFIEPDFSPDWDEAEIGASILVDIA